jgi:hypothetical protein
MSVLYLLDTNSLFTRYVMFALANPYDEVLPLLAQTRDSGQKLQSAVVRRYRDWRFNRLERERAVIVVD